MLFNINKFIKVRPYSCS